VSIVGKGRKFPPGTSGNPGGQPSIKRDLERARVSGVPVEVTETLDEWFLDAHARVRELGADGFIAGLREALTAATQRVMPIDPTEARAMWWRTVFPIFLAGPSGTKDSVWTYTSQEIGVRLLGKPKETIAVEGTDSAAQIDWKKVPEEERVPLGEALLRLQAYLSNPDSSTEH
jgi:hypothetical protein